MDSTEVIYGADFMIFVKDEGVKIPIAYATSVKIDRTMKTRDTSTKIDGIVGSKRPGKHEWTASAECLLSFGVLPGTYGYNKLAAAFEADTLLELTWGVVMDGTLTQDADTTSYRGNAYITTLGDSAGTDDNATCSISFEGDGEIVPIEPDDTWYDENGTALTDELNEILQIA